MPHRKVIAIVKQFAHKLKEGIPHRDAKAEDALDIFHAALGKIDKVHEHLKFNLDHSVKQIERSHHYRGNEFQKAYALEAKVRKMKEVAAANHEAIEAAENQSQIKLANERRKLENASALLHRILDGE